MQVPDLINGIFEGSGGIFIAMSVRRLYLDKIVRGVSPVPVAFFTLWGFWNLFYYPHLGQFVSFAGGIGIVMVNSIWLAMIAYYLMRERRQKAVDRPVVEWHEHLDEMQAHFDETLPDSLGG